MMLELLTEAEAAPELAPRNARVQISLFQYLPLHWGLFILVTGVTWRAVAERIKKQLWVE